MWRAPAWLCPDLRGIADPGQVPDGAGLVVLHREQYVSRQDAERYRHYLHTIPAGRGWTGAHQDENHPGGILSGIGPTHPRPGGRGVPPDRGVDWPEDIVGLLVTPVSMRLDRGRLDHPKKRLRARPTRIVGCSRGWRGLAGERSDLLVVVRHAPAGAGFALHRIARTVRRDGGERDAHLLLTDAGGTGGRIPLDDDLDRFAREGADRATRLVELTHHRCGEGKVAAGPGAIDRRLTDVALARFEEVSQLSVREDLLRDAADVDRIAEEVSSLLLAPHGGRR
jgi:hypothetical protein